VLLVVIHKTAIERTKASLQIVFCVYLFFKAWLMDGITKANHKY